MTGWIGKQIGKYEIKELVGRGGMGAVYKAYHPALERDVAIKLIHTRLAGKPGSVEIYVADSGKLLEIAQSQVERELTCRERVQFLFEDLECPEETGTSQSDETD